MKQNNEGPSRMKVIMARVAIALMVVFIIAACVCMAIGNMALTMAAAFSIVIVPIAIYCFIWVYDMVHKDDDKPVEPVEEEN